MIDRHLKYERVQSTFYLLLSVILSIGLFAAAFNRDFASDDYCSLHYIVDTSGWLMRGFFRPIGDFTLWVNYLVWGFDPWYYYLTNAIIHGVNTWLLFLVCMRLGQLLSFYGKAFPFITAAIFLVYHSHGEAVLWAIGRGVALAVTFSLVSVLIFVGSLPNRIRYFLSSSFYFLAICSYESALLLPFVLLSFTICVRGKSSRLGWVPYFVAAVVLNLLLRFYFTGGLWVSYEGEVFGKPAIEYGLNFIKTGLRIFIPAFDYPILFSVAGGVTVSLLIIFIFRSVRRKPEHEKIILLAVTGIMAGLIMAMFYGVSTRTSEGDRLLYFPAVFFAMLMAALVMQLRVFRLRNIVALMFVFLQLYFLLGTINNWKVADLQAARIREDLRQLSDRPVYLVNLPSDYRGAYQYRNCFKMALVHHKIDTSGINVLSILKYPAGGINPGDLSPIMSSSSVQIPGAGQFLFSNGMITSGQVNGNAVSFPEPFPLENLFYWDGTRLLRLASK